jgi:hypothetical protein
MMKPTPGPWWRSRWIGWAASLFALALVFAWYLQPDLMFELANRVWSCF